MNNMFRLFLKLYIIAAVVTLVATLHSCSEMDVGKKEPEYHGVDPQLKPMVDEYLLLTSRNNIVFNNQVTIGLKDIDDDAVGICNYGKKWREIDVDRTFWKNASDLSKKAMLFHELTHCYCGREHDFGEDKEYKSVEDLRKENKKGLDHEGGGFFPDNCPTSIMYPMVTYDTCMRYHGEYYMKEMLERCEPF